MLEPFANVQNDISLPVPGVFFGTNATCNVPGLDYIVIYDKWQDFKIRLGNSVSFHVISAHLYLKDIFYKVYLKCKKSGVFARIKHGFDSH